MERERDFNFDRRYRSPAAWRHVKNTLGGIGFGFDRLVREIERRCGPGGTSIFCCPRQLLAVALHHYLTTINRDTEREAERRYDGWLSATKATEEEALPPDEVAALADDLAAVRLKLLGGIDYLTAYGCDGVVEHEHIVVGIIEGRGLVITCKHCGKEYRDPNAVAPHMRKAHGIDITADAAGEGSVAHE